MGGTALHLRLFELLRSRRGPEFPVDRRHDLGGEELNGTGRLGERKPAETDLGHIALDAERLVNGENLLHDLLRASHEQATAGIGPVIEGGPWEVFHGAGHVLLEVRGQQGNEQGQAQPPCPDETAVSATHTHPNGKFLLQRPWSDLHTRNGLGQCAPPTKAGVFPQLEQQLELFFKKGVIVPGVVAKQRVGLNEGTAPSNNLGSAVRS